MCAEDVGGRDRSPGRRSGHDGEIREWHRTQPRRDALSHHGVRILVKDLVCADRIYGRRPLPEDKRIQQWRRILCGQGIQIFALIGLKCSQVDESVDAG